MDNTVFKSLRVLRATIIKYIIGAKHCAVGMKYIISGLQNLVRKAVTFILKVKNSERIMGLVSQVREPGLKNTNL